MPGCAAPGDRAHACWRRGSGPVARPLTAVLRVTGSAISTTDRRLTTRPCNLSRAGPSPRRCAARCRPRGDQIARAGERFQLLRGSGTLLAIKTRCEVQPFTENSRALQIDSFVSLEASPIVPPAQVNPHDPGDVAEQRIAAAPRWPGTGSHFPSSAPTTTRSAASRAGSRREINCTAGWLIVGGSWRWHHHPFSIRRSTDERRTQTRGASARVRDLLGHTARTAGATDQSLWGESPRRVKALRRGTGAGRGVTARRGTA